MSNQLQQIGAIMRNLISAVLFSSFATTAFALPTLYPKEAVANALQSFKGIDGRANVIGDTTIPLGIVGSAFGSSEATNSFRSEYNQSQTEKWSSTDALPRFGMIVYGE